MYTSASWFTSCFVSPRGRSNPFDSSSRRSAPGPGGRMGRLWDMRRYCRDEGGLYDRKLRCYLEVREERRIGQHIYINPGAEDERVIDIEDIEQGGG